MKVRALKFCLITALSCVTAAAMAENPFAGTWKIDYSQSTLTGRTVTFTPEAADKVRLTAGGRSYSFKLDGSDATNTFGQTEQWTKVDDHTWKTVTKAGPETDTDTWKLSDDGKMLDVSTTGTKPNGDPVNESDSFTRVTPGKGFFGKWKSTKISDSTPNTRVFEANGDNGLIWSIPEIKASLTLTFDGKDVAPVGPTVPNGLTIAATKLGPRSFELTEKMNGKVMFKGRFTVSEDGKTLTEVGGAPGVNEPEKAVYKKS
ncbi:MAG: hypothetical protein WA419_13860 [Silvibacterium sp.]